MLPIAAFVLLLGGEPVRIDGNAAPRFSDAQITNTAAATRAGFTRWAATPSGKRVLAWFREHDCEIDVVEDEEEDGIGRAPQPGIATLVAAGNRARRTSYQLILNPIYFKVPDGMTPMAAQPATPADMMAIAWAGEMLHVWFYAQGISLPHHQRPDFQREWRAVANDLGMPLLTHDDEFDDWRSRVAMGWD